MANDINTVCMSGNVVKDPETKTFANGGSVMNFRLAVNERRKENDEWTDYANYFDITKYGNVDQLSKFIKKGSKLFIEGRLHWSQWETKDGSKRTKVEVIADKIVLPPKGSGNELQVEEEVVPMVYAEEDLPF